MAHKQGSRGAALPGKGQHRDRVDIAQDDLFPRPFAWSDKKGTAWFGILVGTALPSLLMLWRYNTSAGLTVFTYHYTFRWQNYVITWGWYVAAMALGQILLHSRTTFVRVAAGALLGPTSFFVVSNYAVWIAGGMYPRTLGGLGVCYAAAVPFYRNDLLSTAIVAGLAFGVPVLVRRLNGAQDPTTLAVR